MWFVFLLVLKKTHTHTKNGLSMVRNDESVMDHAFQDDGHQMNPD